MFKGLYTVAVCRFLKDGPELMDPKLHLYGYEVLLPGACTRAELLKFCWRRQNGLTNIIEITCAFDSYPSHS